jgi:hypothetical protein
VSPPTHLCGVGYGWDRFKMSPALPVEPWSPKMSEQSIFSGVGTDHERLIARAINAEDRVKQLEHELQTADEALYHLREALRKTESNENTDHGRLFERCERVFTVNSQKLALIEELSELAAAVSRWMNGKKPGEEVMQEFADVELMMQQAERWFSSDALGTARTEKAAKLTLRVEQLEEAHKQAPEMRGFGT